MEIFAGMIVVLARAAVTVAIKADIDGVTEVSAGVFLRLLLGKRASSDHCSDSKSAITVQDIRRVTTELTFEGLLNIDGFLGAGLKVRKVPF